MSQGQVGFNQPGALTQFNQPGLWLPGDSRAPVVGGDPFLRQTCQVTGFATSSQVLTATFPNKCLGSGGRILAVMVINGSAATYNACWLNGTDFVVDLGGGTLVSTLSLDVLMWDEIATDNTQDQMSFQLGGAGLSGYMACWAGEWSNMDQSNYGFSGNTKSNNGNVDYDSSDGWAGTSQSISLTRAGGQNFNYSPELGIWVICGPGPIPNVQSQSFYADGYVTDNANVWAAIQTGYFNATGSATATWELDKSTGYSACNLTMKTLVYP